ncbi:MULTISPECIES: ABC transporter ATP-binding protein [Roseobacteraceae]|uniref:Spermidine/putrescine import ATP-binding protein PotA n=1 Tax=Pseudosulfitobacter pseudonitzschiae TaxID=1402135 RepID=A0A221JYB4_9RHOB|nr:MULTISPECIES: ABC transporter ATP-binding protein [Roseobacteraceae]ASM71724.1 spermidine/putrescine import ATP-binding protein PotA [Pseudosulfitobacter pseudonitzschiae]
MIELRTVSKIYGVGAAAYQALQQTDLLIGEGEFFTLLGPSGCGKTTLLRMIAGFEAPSSGEIILDGKDITELPPSKRPVNTVFQNYALFPHMTVVQNIAFGLETLGKPRKEINATVDKMLALVQMEHLRDRRISALSGGQQQRVALARALAPRPRILLLDEPLSALDLKLRKEMQIELKRLQNQTGITFVFVTHDQEEALTMSDRIAVINAGTIRQIASPRELYEAPQDRFVADFIGESNYLDARIVTQVGQPDEVLIAGKHLFKNVTSQAGQGALSAMVRPEKICLGIPIEGSDCMCFEGVVSDIVYIGTDTQVHVMLDEGFDLVARLQNANPLLTKLGQGDRTQLSIPRDAVRLVHG